MEPTLPTRGRIVRLTRITREMVRSDRNTVFVYGDNMEGRGLGGQAREMRGEPNTIGIPTKWFPARAERAYFTDDDRHNRDVWHAIHGSFQRIRAALDAGRNVAFPSDGIGTGLAELPTRAPKLYAMIEAATRDLTEPPSPAPAGDPPPAGVLPRDA